MSKYRNPLIAIAALVPFLAGCHDSKAASNENFEKALQSHYDAHPVCITLPLSLPTEIGPDPLEPTHRQLEALAKAGLLATSTTQKPEPTFSGPGKLVAYTTYSVSATGKVVFRTGDEDFPGGTGLCFAKRKITKIESFTEPADLIGQKVSRVTYDYTLMDVAPWTEDAGIAAAFPEIKAILAKPANQQTDGMILTSTGWKQERDVQ